MESKSPNHRIIEEEMRKICNEYKIDKCEVKPVPKGYSIELTKGSKETKFTIFDAIMGRITSGASYVRNTFNEKAYSWVVER